MKHIKRKTGLAAATLLLALLAIRCVSFSQPPVGQAGPDADLLAQKMQNSVDIQAWQRTGAVRWTFANRHHHLWDRQRQLAQVTWGEGKDKVVAVLKINQPSQGVVLVGGRQVEAAEKTQLLTQAYEKWANDSFWLNPVAKVFDPGTVRKRVTSEGKPQLLVTYTDGGVTPGDSYLFTLGPNGRPEKWQMWVKIIPVGGVESTFEGWKKLQTGAWVSTQHKTAVMDLKLTAIKAATSVVELEGEDPFLVLL